MTQNREQLLQTYAALPEAYQPAWGLDETRTQARRGSADRFALLLRHIAALPGEAPLRVLDIGCAQGYFALGLTAELRERGIEVIGVDALADNVRFCEQLVAHHGLEARFLHDRFDAGFFQRHAFAHFDAVLALNVLHHIRELQGAQAMEAALAAIRTHSRVLFCELAQRDEALDWIGDWHESDHALLGDYAFRRRLGEFETHLTQVRRPLYACSNDLACVDGKWFPFERVQERAHPNVPERFAGQRRFFIGKDTIVKAYRADGDFGSFNRAELKAEAEVLRKLGDEPQRYPLLLAQCDDGDRVWLARAILPGRLVSELIEAHEDFDRGVLLRALLEELAHLEERGYHHADIRAWNMLWHQGGVRLIDFGSMMPSSSPLHRIALAAVIAELASGTLQHEEAWYLSLRPLTDYPAEWRDTIRYLYGSPEADFRYREAMKILEAKGSCMSQMPQEIHADVLAACAQAQIGHVRRLREHLADIERHLRDTAAQARYERESAGKALREAEDYAASLRARILRQEAEARAERAEAARALADAAGHAESLKSRLERQEAEARAEHAAAAKALADAAGYAESLKSQLERQEAEARAEHAAAAKALADANQYARSLETERAQLKARVADLETRLDLMRRRFRLLKPLWPREQGNAE